MDIWHILLITILILIGSIMIIVGLKKFSEERQHYSLKVKGKFIGYDTIEEAIERDIEKNKHNLDRINEMEAAKKSLNGLISPVYEAEIDGKKVIFKGKATYRQNTSRERAKYEIIRTATIRINPNDYEDYITDTTVTAYPIFLFAGALFLFCGIGLIISPI